MDEELFLLNQQVSKAQMEEIQKRQAAEAMQASDSEIAELRYRIYQMEQERLLEKRMELQFNMMQSAILQNMQGTYIPSMGYHYNTNLYDYTPNLNVYSLQFETGLKENFAETKSKPIEVINIEPVKKKSFAEKVAEKLDSLDALKDKIAEFVWDNIL